MIYAINTQKGGTGKTTTAASLLQAATLHGLATIGIDLDPQGDLTYCLAGDLHAPGSYELLQGAPSSEVIQHTRQKVDIIAGTPELQTLASMRGSARRLQESIEPLKSIYDLIIIDTPPTAGELQYNALQAAERLLIPLVTDAYSLNALQQVADTADLVRQSNPGLKIAGVIVTQYDARAIINRQMLDTVKAAAEARNIPFLGTVRKAVAAAEAAALRRSIYEYAPKSNPAVDYMEIYSKLETGRDRI